MSFVYFIQSPDGGPIKIGHTLHPLLRLKQIQAHSPVPVAIKAAMSGTPKLEKEYHARFKALRLHGEWFEPDAELISFMDEIGLPDNLGQVPNYNADFKSVSPYRPK